MVYSLSLSYWDGVFGKSGHSLLLETFCSLGFSELPLLVSSLPTLFLPSWQCLPQTAIWVMFYKHFLNYITIQWFSSYVFSDTQTLGMVCGWTLPSFPSDRGRRNPTLLPVRLSPATLVSYYPSDSPGAFQTVVPSPWNVLFTIVLWLPPLYLGLSQMSVSQETFYDTLVK